MPKTLALCLGALLCLVIKGSHAQTIDSATVKVINFPSKLLDRIQSKNEWLSKQLTKKTEHYLDEMARKERRLKEKLYKKDSAAAKRLFANSEQQYAALSQKMRQDTSKLLNPTSRQYQPYVDSLQCMLKFLQQSPSSSVDAGKLQSSLTQLQQLQSRMAAADVAQNYIQQRKQQIGTYLSQQVTMENLLGKPYTNLRQDMYYYKQQVDQYKEMLNDPDQLERKTLQQLRQLPAFQTFMQKNSQLSMLFGSVQSSSPAQALAGLQTQDQVSQLVQGQISSGGAGGMDAVQTSLQSAKSQISALKDRLEKSGSGGDPDMPDFKPNDQKTKTFWRRLQYGINVQTSRNSYFFPTTTDLGLSLGYQLGHSNVVGIGASYKLGWGNGLQHLALSSQGVGLRSFLDIKLKGSLSATGGFEYNYATPFSSFQNLRQIQDWTRSGLIGVTKTVTLKNKKSTVSLLWDFLSYQQVPRTQPLLFRVGYVFP